MKRSLKNVGFTAGIVGAIFTGKLLIASDLPLGVSATPIESNFFSKARWSINYFNYMNGPTLEQAEGGSINHYFTLKHKLNSDWYIAGILQPDSNFANQKSLVAMGDPYFQIGYPIISTISEGKIFGQVRYYLPISDSSRKTEIAGIVSTRIYAELEKGPLQFTYIFIPKLYLNTKSENGQIIFSHGHWMQATYKVTNNVALDFALYPAWTYSLNSEIGFNNLLAYPGFTLKFSNDLALSPYLEVPLFKVEGKSTSIGASLSYNIL